MDSANFTNGTEPSVIQIGNGDSGGQSLLLRLLVGGNVVAATIGVPNNLIIMFVFLLNTQLRAHHWMIALFVLAVFDLTYVCSALCMRLVYYVHAQDWQKYTRVQCVALVLMARGFGDGSLRMLTWLGIDRLQAVHNPVTYMKANHRLRTAVATVVILLSLTPDFVASLWLLSDWHKTPKVCLGGMYLNKTYLYVSSLGTVVTVVVMAGVYVTTILLIQKKKKASLKVEPTSTYTAAKKSVGAGTQNKKQSDANKKKSTDGSQEQRKKQQELNKLVLIIVLTCVCLHGIPVIAMMLLQWLKWFQWLTIAKQTRGLCISINAMVNFYVYVFKHKMFRSALQNTMRCGGHG